MRIIDADMVIKNIHERSYISKSLSEIFETIIDEQPTAYDADEIVHRLDDESFLVATSKEFWDDPQNGKYVENVVRLSDAIGIVRKGGKYDK